jgi:cyclophilin family peptidyl-prolyl cis-trans isomerase
LSLACKEKEKDMPNPVVVLDTTKGTIKIEVFTTDVPGTGKNFIDLVGRGFYNGLSFHRYEPGFVIQGGCPKGTGTGGFIDEATGRERRIALEVKKELKHDKAGMVAMARSNDPNSASSQFYITLAPATFLDMNYAVFGQVVEGLDAALQLRAGDKMNKVYELTAAKS